jgi:hypothetical protein
MIGILIWQTKSVNGPAQKFFPGIGVQHLA